MASAALLAQYQKQFDALMAPGKVVDQMLSLYGGLTAYDPVTGTGDLPRRDTILGLLNRFREFTPAHFDFFIKGFATGASVSLFESRMVPTSAVLATILYQMAEDLELIQRAAEQRRLAQFRPTLAEADKLAWLAVQQALPILSSTNLPITALTYFHKMPQIRVVPYAPIALVGIPLSAVYEKRDYLAIPHEVGHFVYHRRKIDPFKDAVNRSYAFPRERKDPARGIQSDWAHWQEEIFADVFGALIAGPVMAYDFQQLMGEYERRAFVSMADDHPTAAIRPLIYTHVLKQNPKYNGLVKLLDKAWHDVLEERWRGTFANRGENVLKQPRGSAEKQEWRAILGNPTSSDFKVLQKNMTLERLAAMRVQDTVKGLEWDGEKQNYLAQLYDAVRLMDISANKLELISPVRDLVDAARALIPITPTNWSGKLAQMRKQLKTAGGQPDKPFKDALDKRTAGVTVTDLAETAPKKLWEAWITGEKFFGGNLPQDLATAAGGTVIISKGEYDEVVLGRPIPKPTDEDPVPYSWVPVWHAGGWTSLPPRMNPPGG